MLKNLHYPISSENLEDQIKELSQQFGDGMDYGYIQKEPFQTTFSEYYVVDLVCPQGAVASTRFLWNPKTNTSLYAGDSVNGHDFVLPADMIKEAVDKLDDLSQTVKDLVKELLSDGGVTDSLDLIYYAVSAIERVGIPVGSTGKHSESDYTFLADFDESSELGMIYYTEHPKFQYSI